jgi:hypothetical protein
VCTNRVVERAAIRRFINCSERNGMCTRMHYKRASAMVCAVIRRESFISIMISEIIILINYGIVSVTIVEKGCVVE